VAADGEHRLGLVRRLRLLNRDQARVGRPQPARLGALVTRREVTEGAVGARSGAQRTNPVGWFAGNDGSWLIVASAAGAARNPAWYHNIAAHPGQVKIELTGRTIPVTAEQLHGAERDQAWHQITTAAPRFAAYQRKTDRELPIIRLTPRSG
jgi:deazaflavin-dependent oxidoreductase (nitroreductase family)